MDPNAAGKTFPPYEFHVERGKIREFADAIEDPNPIYRDPAYAAKQGFAGIPAPPTLLRTFLYEPRAAADALAVKGLELSSSTVSRSSNISPRPSPATC